MWIVVTFKQHKHEHKTHTFDDKEDALAFVKQLAIKTATEKAPDVFYTTTFLHAIHVDIRTGIATLHKTDVKFANGIYVMDFVLPNEPAKSLMQEQRGE